MVHERVRAIGFADEFGYDVLRTRWNPGTLQWDDWASIPLGPDSEQLLDTPPKDGRFAYLVRAYNPAGASDWAIATTSYTADTVAPPAPTGLSLQSGTAVLAAWTDVADHEHGFDVLRATFDESTGTWGDWTFFGLDLDSELLGDGTAPARQLAYLVRSYNSHGPSEWVIATIDRRPPPAD